MAPFENSSGSSVQGKSQVSHWANKDTKALLHMAAMSAVNMQGDIVEYYQRKVQAGKNKMAVLNAAAVVRNKLIKRVFAVVNRGTNGVAGDMKKTIRLRLFNPLKSVRAKLINRVFATVNRGTEYVILRQYRPAA